MARIAAGPQIRRMALLLGDVDGSRTAMVQRLRARGRAFLELANVDQHPRGRLTLEIEGHLHETADERRLSLLATDSEPPGEALPDPGLQLGSGVGVVDGNGLDVLGLEFPRHLVPDADRHLFGGEILGDQADPGSFLVLVGRGVPGRLHVRRDGDARPHRAAHVGGRRVELPDGRVVLPGGVDAPEEEFGIGRFEELLTDHAVEGTGDPVADDVELPTELDFGTQVLDRNAQHRREFLPPLGPFLLGRVLVAGARLHREEDFGLRVEIGGLDLRRWIFLTASREGERRDQGDGYRQLAHGDSSWRPVNPARSIRVGSISRSADGHFAAAERGGASIPFSMSRSAASRDEAKMVSCSEPPCASMVTTAGKSFTSMDHIASGTPSGSSMCTPWTFTTHCASTTASPPIACR